MGNPCPHLPGSCSLSYHRLLSKPLLKPLPTSHLPPPRPPAPPPLPPEVRVTPSRKAGVLQSLYQPCQLPTSVQSWSRRGARTRLLGPLSSPNPTLDT